MEKKQSLHIVGKTICTNKDENTWGILTSSINGVPNRTLIIDSISHRDEIEKTWNDTELSTVVVGLEIILQKCGVIDECGLPKTFKENEDIEIMIRF
jgi:hypothetical protein